MSSPSVVCVLLLDKVSFLENFYFNFYKGVIKLYYYGSLRIADIASLKKYRDDLYKLTYFKTPVMQSGFESSEGKNYRRKCTVNDKKLDNNLIRAKSKVFELAVCNDFEYFVTFTISPEKYDRHNFEVYYKDFRKFLKYYNKKYNTKVQYILVPEMHEDGAWHMHGLIKGIIQEHLIINEHGYLDWIHYRDKFGWISLSPVKDIKRVSSYITKYVVKSLCNSVLGLNKHVYYRSKGLKTAKEIKKGMLVDNIPWDFENDYVKVKWFNNSDINIITWLRCHDNFNT